MTDPADFLEARDARQRELTRALFLFEGSGCLLMAGTNVPGPDKHAGGLAALLDEALERLARTHPLRILVSGLDALGPWRLAHVPAPAEAVKAAAVAVEGLDPAARLLDLDVYRPNGSQAGRAALGLPPRTCLLCDRPAVDCIRSQAHPVEDLRAQVDRLLATVRRAPTRIAIDQLAEGLHLGALRELELTPKPGLVDRRDRGSHPDLSFDAMRTSAQLLPQYYEDLLGRGGCQAPLAGCVEAGRDAEARMFAEIGTNGHRGYIFLSGLALLGACASGGRLEALPGAIAQVAAAFFQAHPPAPSTHGASIRARLGLGGIQAEAERGLPAVFETGWPAYRAALARGWDPDRAAFKLMAVLMQVLEDTTMVRRGGLAGLARLREAGAQLEALLDAGDDPLPYLTALNLAWCRDNLTMGGVADCMALTFALHDAAH